MFYIINFLFELLSFVFLSSIMVEIILNATFQMHLITELFYYTEYANIIVEFILKL